MFIFPIPLTIFTFDPPVFGIEIVGAEKPSFAICSAFISVSVALFCSTISFIVSKYKGNVFYVTYGISLYFLIISL